MKKKTNIRIALTTSERQKLRTNKTKIADLLNFSIDELEVILDVPFKQAKDIHAMAEFQAIPSIGVKFAEDLIFLDYYSIKDLKGKDGAKLTEEFELRKGYWMDPCIEDQFRLIVHHANTGDTSKNWWDFTEVRKKHRIKNGYPNNRPKLAWHETLDY